jgi:hypothetical protein
VIKPERDITQDHFVANGDESPPLWSWSRLRGIRLT